jgi:hypothetical protein
MHRPLVVRHKTVTGVPCLRSRHALARYGVAAVSGTTGVLVRRSLALRTWHATRWVVRVLAAAACC